MKSLLKLSIFASTIAIAVSLPAVAQGVSAPGDNDMAFDLEGVGLAPPLLAIDVPPPMMPQEGIVANMGGGPMAGLNLTDDQYEKIYAIKRDARVKAAARMAELAAAEANLHDLLLAGTIDRGKIQATQDRINALKAEQASQRTNALADMLSVLSADQRLQLHKQFVRAAVGGGGPFGMGKHFRHGHHMGGMRGPGMCPPGMCPPGMSPPGGPGGPGGQPNMPPPPPPGDS